MGSRIYLPQLLIITIKSSPLSMISCYLIIWFDSKKKRKKCLVMGSAAPPFWGWCYCFYCWAQKLIQAKKKPLVKNLTITTRIGVVLDSGSQIGKQQMVAMKMGLKDFHLASSCVKLELLLHDSNPNFTSPHSSGNPPSTLFKNLNYLI